MDAVNGNPGHRCRSSLMNPRAMDAKPFNALLSHQSANQISHLAMTIASFKPYKSHSPPDHPSTRSAPDPPHLNHQHVPHTSFVPPQQWHDHTRHRHWVCIVQVLQVLQSDETRRSCWMGQPGGADDTRVMIEYAIKASCFSSVPHTGD